MPIAVVSLGEAGQFDDAPEEQSPPIINTEIVPNDPREGHHFIDEEGLLAWSEESSEDEEDEFEVEEDLMEVEAYETIRAEDEDWEQTERDFTKQYNRLKQHVAVRTGAAQGIMQSGNRSAVAALPAVNRPRLSKSTTPDAKTQQSKDRTENQLQALSKYSSRLRNLDIPYELGVGVNRKGPSATANQKDKSDRATSEQVLDPRTRIILFKMIGRGLLFEVNGCVSTGKEANVYHALTPERKHLALKIYKTSILVFKDRDRYVSGEYRFRRGYSRHNPRKMVRVWAEKEMRNLRRLKAAGLRCPEAVEVRENVLVMGFIGDEDGWASPRLKDADIPSSAIGDLYAELILMVRTMFHECKLVHADLSEYNILYHVQSFSSSFSNAPEFSTISDEVEADPASTEEQTLLEPHGHLYIIDVSQSVEHDHPHAFDFLRSDLKNVEDFFSKRGVKCLTLRRSFEFVTTTELEGVESPEESLRRWIEEDVLDDEAPADESHGGSNGVMHEDSVFMQSYIPRTLNEVYDPERDVGALERGEGKGLIYKDTIGIVAPKAKEEDGNFTAPTVRFDDARTGEAADGGSDDDEYNDDDDSESGDEENGEFKDRKPRGHRHEDKDAKKERKKVAKEEAREKRKHKIPKAEKKRKVKNTARGK